MKQLIGHTVVSAETIEAALVNFRKWDNSWWDRLEIERQVLIQEYKSKLKYRLTPKCFKPSENEMVRSFSGSILGCEYLSVKFNLAKDLQDEFSEWYGDWWLETATSLKSLIKTSYYSDIWLNDVGCKFVRKWRGEDVV